MTARDHHPWRRLDCQHVAAFQSIADRLTAIEAELARVAADLDALAAEFDDDA